MHRGDPNPEQLQEKILDMHSIYTERAKDIDLMQIRADMDALNYQAFCTSTPIPFKYSTLTNTS